MPRHKLKPIPILDEIVVEDALFTSDYYSEGEALRQLWMEDEYGDSPSGADLRKYYLEIGRGCYVPRSSKP